MELASSFLLRLVAILTAMTFAHLVTRRFGATDMADKASPVLLILLAALGMAGMPHSSSLITVWALIWLAFCVAQMLEPLRPVNHLWEQGQWITAWGLTLAVPITLFSQLDLYALTLAQEGKVADLLPAWGVVYNPLALALAVLALAGWTRQVGASISIRHPVGMLTGLFLLTTVACFLGGWHVPWVLDSDLEASVGMGIALALYWITVAVKISLLWLAILWLNQPQRNRIAQLSSYSLSILSSSCLVLTWMVLAWKGPR